MAASGRDRTNEQLAFPVSVTNDSNLLQTASPLAKTVPYPFRSGPRSEHLALPNNLTDVEARLRYRECPHGGWCRVAVHSPPHDERRQHLSAEGPRLHAATYTRP